MKMLRLLLLVCVPLLAHGSGYGSDYGGFGSSGYGGYRSSGYGSGGSSRYREEAERISPDQTRCDQIIADGVQDCVKNFRFDWLFGARLLDANSRDSSCCNYYNYRKCMYNLSSLLKRVLSREGCSQLADYNDIERFAKPFMDTVARMGCGYFDGGICDTGRPGGNAGSGYGTNQQPANPIRGFFQNILKNLRPQEGGSQGPPARPQKPERPDRGQRPNQGPNNQGPILTPINVDGGRPLADDNDDRRPLADDNDVLDGFLKPIGGAAGQPEVATPIPTNIRDEFSSFIEGADEQPSGDRGRTQPDKSDQLNADDDIFSLIDPRRLVNGGARRRSRRQADDGGALSEVPGIVAKGFQNFLNGGGASESGSGLESLLGGLGGERSDPVSTILSPLRNIFGVAKEGEQPPLLESIGQTVRQIVESARNGSGSGEAKESLVERLRTRVQEQVESMRSKFGTARDALGGATDDMEGRPSMLKPVQDLIGPILGPVREAIGGGEDRPSIFTSFRSLVSGGKNGDDGGQQGSPLSFLGLIDGFSVGGRDLFSGRATKEKDSDYVDLS